jgi:hypothetical protein
MEAKWLASLRLHLRKLDARIEVDNAYIPSLERLHDRHIMDMVLQSPHFTSKDIRLINYCRLYLQVVTVSDITTAEGTGLDPTMLIGTRTRLSSRTKWHHFHQKKPSSNAWKTWRRANRLWATAQ